MKYEIDFIGINKEGKDADAICFRYFNGNDNKYHIGIYDGGTNDYGIEMKDHIKKYYKQNSEKIVIDFVVCSHSDLDHASGLTEILNEFEVKKVYVNLPWLYVDELYEIVKYGRITKNSLEEKLRDVYKYVDDIEKVCREKNIPILELEYPETRNDIINLIGEINNFLDYLTEYELNRTNKKYIKKYKLENEENKEDYKDVNKIIRDSLNLNFKFI